MNKIKKSTQINRYKRKLIKMKALIREYVHENAALCDEINDTQEKILMRNEERKFLLKKLCLYEPQTEIEVETLSKSLYNNSTVINTPEVKKTKKRPTNSDKNHTIKPKRSTPKHRKKIVLPIELDPTGRPVFPIELGTLTIHSLGEVVCERKEFHSEEAIYPVGFVSTKIYGSVKDPTIKCVYTCTISDNNGTPRFEIASDDNSQAIVGGTPDVCHTLLLQKINDTLSLNVVTTRPRGNDFFGLSHPTVLNLIQCSPGSRKCSSYKWSRFEVSKTGDQFLEDNDITLSYDMLQRSIDYCKYKMAPTMVDSPTTDYYRA